MYAKLLSVDLDGFIFFDAEAEAFGLTPTPPPPIRADAWPATTAFGTLGSLEASAGPDQPADAAPIAIAAPPSEDDGAWITAHSREDRLDATSDAALPDGQSPDVDALRVRFTSAVAARAQRADADDFTGDGKAIVVIDTGWSPFYDRSNTVFSYDFSGRNDADASVRTLYSHGSWVAEVATGVAEDADIIHLKVFDDAGRGASTRDIEEALRWTIRNVDGFDVVAVNLSLGFGNATSATRTHLSDEFAALDRMGVFVSVAAGNDGQRYKNGVNVLAADPSVVGVSATTSADRFASWSQKHAAMTDIAALGDRVYVESTVGAAFLVSGTSFAAPYVSGAVARIQEAAEHVFGRGAQLQDEAVLGILRASGDRVVGASKSWGGAVVADADAAVDWFLDHASAYADSVFV
ncbi:MAG: S8 family serine peptidase [Rubrimonas sp.]|uniref:S8 family peptidase n=1 Tax=Rubrimonas sp. TaxID=2036015 RepID=UPI002FDCC5CB